tara:strand:- start:576 stop:803 length:228 start_codon:yes stop_codon:yes gene_type:complete
MIRKIFALILIVVFFSCEKWSKVECETYIAECYSSSLDSAFCKCSLEKIKFKFNSLEEALQNEEKLPEIFLDCQN